MISSADFLRWLNHIHKSWPSLSFVWICFSVSISIRPCCTTAFSRAVVSAVVSATVVWLWLMLGIVAPLPSVLLSSLYASQSLFLLLWTKHTGVGGCLPVIVSWQRFIYKLLVLTYKALHTGQPCYLADLIDIMSHLDVYDLLIVTFLLFIPVLNHLLPLELFYVCLPNNWNSLPLHIGSSDSLVTFQSRLKSHLFSSAYHV